MQLSITQTNKNDTARFSAEISRNMYEILTESKITVHNIRKETKMRIKGIVHLPPSAIYPQFTLYAWEVIKKTVKHPTPVSGGNQILRLFVHFVDFTAELRPCISYIN